MEKYNIKQIANEFVESIKEKGADKGQVFVTESEYREFNMENGEFTLLRTVFEKDSNVLLYKDNKKGSYYSNSMDVENAVDMALSAAEAGNEDEAYDIAPYQGEISAEKGVYEPDIDKLFERTSELVKTIEREYPKIVVNNLIVSHSCRHMAYANTNGTHCEERNGSYNIGIQMAGHEGENTTSIAYAGVMTKSLDRPFIELGDLRNQLKITQAQLKAQPMEGRFTGTMIITPPCLNQFIWYIIGLVSGSAILDGTSIWLDKLGSQVADKRVSIRLDNTDERVVCGETITFDGFKSEPYDLIRDGVLKSFFIDYYISRKTGYERQKNGGGNFFVEPGEESIEDIIKGVENGILVNGFSGGNPAINGDFSGVAKNSFLIKDGKIERPLTETMISGNLADMLMKLVGISKETLFTGEDVMPYMAFDGILVSGK